MGQKPEKKIAIIDFDGTLCKFEFPDVGPIEPNVKEALETLKEAGYIIKIHSCRTATYWGDPAARAGHLKAMQDFMIEHKLPYDEIIMSADKPIGVVYIDDRAMRYDNNWLEIAQKLKNEDAV